MTTKTMTKTDKKPKQETSGKDRQNQLDRELADNSVCHSMVVRLKFLRPGSPQKAAAVEPFSRALLGALHEMTRHREIVWRHFERTERRHDANIDLVGEPLEIVDEPPRDQQGDCVQGPSDRPSSKAQAYPVGSTTIRDAPRSAATRIGVSLAIAPSISVWPSIRTGGKTPGIAVLARMASIAGPFERTTAIPSTPVAMT
jgi:hypothetical protein